MSGWLVIQRALETVSFEKKKKKWKELQMKQKCDTALYTSIDFKTTRTSKHV